MGGGIRSTEEGVAERTYPITPILPPPPLPLGIDSSCANYHNLLLFAPSYFPTFRLCPLLFPNIPSLPSLISQHSVFAPSYCLSLIVFAPSYCLCPLLLSLPPLIVFAPSYCLCPLLLSLPPLIVFLLLSLPPHIVFLLLSFSYCLCPLF